MTDKWKEYRIVQTLGKGSQGKVREAIHIPTNQKCAIKTIRKDASSMQVAQRESNILRRIIHPHIIRLLDEFETKNSWALVFELAEGGNLFDKITESGQFTERDAAVCLATIINAIGFLHERHIVHRDLKTPNLMFRDKTKDSPLVILDFGVAKKMTDDMVSTQTGSPMFMAPEILKGKGYDERVDMWSIGIIAYVMLTGVHPCVPYQDTPDLFQKILAGHFDYSSPEWQLLSPEAADFVQTLLQVNPELRMTAKQAMKHAWIQKFVPSSYLEMLENVNKEAAVLSDGPEEKEIPTTPPMPKREDPFLPRLRGATTSQLPDFKSSEIKTRVRSRTMSDKLPGVLQVSTSMDTKNTTEPLPNLLDGGAQHRFRSIVRHMVSWGRLARRTSSKTSELPTPLSAPSPSLSLASEIRGVEPAKAPQLEQEDWDQLESSEEEAEVQKKFTSLLSGEATSAKKQDWVAYEPDLNTKEQMENLFGY